MKPNSYEIKVVKRCPKCDWRIFDRFDWLLVCISKFFSRITITGEGVLQVLRF